jgi:hypothetical protein
MPITLTIQPSTIDNYLDENIQNNNYGTATYVRVGHQFRGIFKFDFSSLPAGSTINTATLNLYYYANEDDPVGRTYWAYRLIQRNWTETGSNWGHYATSTHWASNGGDYTATDGASLAVPAGFGWMQWNVLAQVQFAQSYTDKVAHFIVKDGDEGSGKHANFYSREYTTDTSLCPKLILTYTAGSWTGEMDGVATQEVDGIAIPEKVDGV